MDFVLRCMEHEVLLKYPETESSNTEQRSIHKISDNERLRIILYVDDIVLFCEDINELNNILNIYDETYSRFGLTIATDKTKTISLCSRRNYECRITDNIRK